MIDRLWALAMMGLARPALRGVEGLGFWKICGAGSGEGFTPRPDPSVCAILGVWPDDATARRQIAEARVFRAFARRAVESWTVYLAPIAARGRWSGVSPFCPGPAPGARGPVAALTRATLRPAIALRFWRRVPAISRRIGANPDVAFKIGIGEVPWMQQVTFSIWPDDGAMAAFARAEGAHAAAIRAVREGGWFREELYARFRILDAVGSWDGRRPLAGYGIGAA